MKKPRKRLPEAKDLPLFKAIGWEPPEDLGPRPEIPPLEARSIILPDSPMRRGAQTLRAMRGENGTCLSCGDKRAGPDVPFGDKLCAHHSEMNQQHWDEYRRQMVAKLAEWERKKKAAGTGK